MKGSAFGTLDLTLENQIRSGVFARYNLLAGLFGVLNIRVAARLSDVFITVDIVLSVFMMTTVRAA